MTAAEDQGIGWSELLLSPMIKYTTYVVKYINTKSSETERLATIFHIQKFYDLPLELCILDHKHPSGAILANVCGHNHESSLFNEYFLGSNIYGYNF